MIDLESKRKNFYHFNFKTGKLKVLEFIESNFGPFLNNAAKVEPSNLDESRPRFNKISDVDFTLNSPLVPCNFFSCQNEAYARNKIVLWPPYFNLGPCK